MNKATLSKHKPTVAASETKAPPEKSPSGIAMAFPRFLREAAVRVVVVPAKMRMVDHRTSGV